MLSTEFVSDRRRAIVVGWVSARPMALRASCGQCCHLQNLSKLDGWAVERCPLGQLSA